MSTTRMYNSFGEQFPRGNFDLLGVVALGQPRAGSLFSSTPRLFLGSTWRIVAGSKIGPKFVDEDACQMGEITREGCRLPPTRMMVETETIVVRTERCQAGNGFFVGMDVKEAALRLDGNLEVVAETADRRDESLGFFGGGLAAFCSLHVPPGSTRQVCPRLAEGTR